QHHITLKYAWHPKLLPHLQPQSVHYRKMDPSEWELATELPLEAEITSATPGILLSNPVDRPTNDKSEYLQRQYLLLRHEGVEPLRRSVREYIADPEMTESASTAVYTKVCMGALHRRRPGMLTRLAGFRSRLSLDANWRVLPGRLLDGEGSQADSM